MKKFTVLCWLLLLTPMTIFVSAQAPMLQAQKSLGGSENDFSYSIQQTTDGGYIIAGFTASSDGNVSSNNGDEDFWIVKLNKNGSIRWEKTFGGFADDKAFSIQQTRDGGYIVAGESSSFDGDVTTNNGMLDFWIVKLDANGNLVWQRPLGGSNNDFANSVQQTTDGGYIVAGGSFSGDGDVTVHHGPSIYADYWIVKLDALGFLEWQKAYGGSKGDIATDIRQTTDGGYIVAGNSASIDGDVRNVHDNIYGDFWILKLDAQGNIKWQQAFGGSDYEQANSVLQTADGGYVAAGWSRTPNNGNVTGNHGNYDMWVVKMNANGTLQWQKSLGGSESDLGYGIQQTADNGYVVGGATYSNNGDVSGNHGKQDFWLVKLNGNGNLLWQKTMGGSEYEEAFSVALTKDGGYAMAGFNGFANVNNGDVSGNHGNYDWWLTKLSSSGLTANEFTQQDIQLAKPASGLDLKISPNPASSFLYVTVNSKHTNALLRITNNAGQVFIEKSITKEQSNYQQQINISKLAAGVYVVSVQLVDNIVSKTFVKK